jgi:hypothetical protein
MTKLLERAIDEIKRLPDTDQDKLAAIILDELHAEKRWDEAFQKSQDELGKLADEALNERASGRATPLKF